MNRFSTKPLTSLSIMLGTLAVSMSFVACESNSNEQSALNDTNDSTVEKKIVPVPTDKQVNYVKLLLNWAEKAKQKGEMETFVKHIEKARHVLASGAGGSVEVSVEKKLEKGEIKLDRYQLEDIHAAILEFGSEADPGDSCSDGGELVASVDLVAALEGGVYTAFGEFGFECENEDRYQRGEWCEVESKDGKTWEVEYCDS